MVYELGNLYVLAVTGDYSRFTYTSPALHKLEASNVLHQFFTGFERQSGSRTTNLHIDGGAVLTPAISYLKVEQGDVVAICLHTPIQWTGCGSSMDNSLIAPGFRANHCSRSVSSQISLLSVWVKLWLCRKQGAAVFAYRNFLARRNRPIFN